MDKIYTKVNITAWQDRYCDSKLESRYCVWFLGRLSKNEVSDMINQQPFIDIIKIKLCTSVFIIGNITYSELPKYKSVKIIYKEEINNKNMEYKYFVKSEDEFINEFGKDWRNTIKMKWPISMDSLLGKEIINPTFNFDNVIKIDTDSGIINFLTEEMYKKVESPIIKKYKYVIKTENDFESQYGKNWRFLTKLKFNSLMDNLFGKELIENVEEFGDNSISYKIHGITYFLSDDMYDKIEINDTQITKDEISEVNNKTEDDENVYFVKTKQEFELEFGLFWRKNLTKVWFYEMDFLFGVQLTDVDTLNDCYLYKTKGNKYFCLSDDMIKIVKKNKIVKIDKIDTKVEIIIKNDDKTYHLHSWAQDRKSWDEVISIFNSNETKYLIMGKYGQGYEHRVGGISYTNRPANEYYKMLYTDSTIIDITPNSNNNSSKDIDLDKMSDKELSNLKDRIDEILFKRTYEFTDDEYEFYLDNEEDIRPEDVKSFFIQYKSDKFKLKKNKIRLNLKLKEKVVN